MNTDKAQLVEIIVNIILAVLTLGTLVVAIIANCQTVKALKEAKNANTIASTANQIAKKVQEQSVNIELLDRRQDILDRIQKCEQSKLSIEDLAPRIEKEQYDIVSADDIQILFLDDQHINRSFNAFNECRNLVTKMCSDMDLFCELCHSNHPGSIIWKKIVERYKVFEDDQNRDISTKESEAEFRNFCHEHIQYHYISDEAVEEYDFL